MNSPRKARCLSVQREAYKAAVIDPRDVRLSQAPYTLSCSRILKATPEFGSAVLIVRPNAADFTPSNQFHLLAT
jgi:hypothetical protein